MTTAYTMTAKFTKHGVLREGTFNPKNIETLKPEAIKYIGKKLFFMYAWLIEPDEDYAGQNAYTLHPEKNRYSYLDGVVWCPEEDITWLTEG